MNKPSLISVVERYVYLREAGNELIGLCPFHEERTPSFFVNEDKGVFHCFGCGEAGDVVRFIELLEQTDFKGAVKILGIHGGKYNPKPIGKTRNKRGAAVDE